MEKEVIENLIDEVYDNTCLSGMPMYGECVDPIIVKMSRDTPSYMQSVMSKKKKEKILYIFLVTIPLPKKRPSLRLFNVWFKSKF
jgi:hypothetical protein